MPRPFDKGAQERVYLDFHSKKGRLGAYFHTKRVSNSGFTHAKKGILKMPRDIWNDESASSSLTAEKNYKRGRVSL